MEKTWLEQLIELRNSLEDVYVVVIERIRREQLANAVVTLANNEGVMLMLDRQNLQDNVGGDE